MNYQIFIFLYWIVVLRFEQITFAINTIMTGKSFWKVENQVSKLYVSRFKSMTTFTCLLDKKPCKILVSSCRVFVMSDNLVERPLIYILLRVELSSIERVPTMFKARNEFNAIPIFVRR